MNTKKGSIIMANVKMIYVNNDGSFAEQECSDPHEFWSGRNCGAEYLAAIPKEKYKARIQTDGDFELYVYEVADVYALRIALKEETIEVSKTFNLDISIQGLVKAAEEEINAVRIVEQAFKQTNKQEISSRRRCVLPYVCLVFILFSCYS